MYSKQNNVWALSLFMTVDFTTVIVFYTVLEFLRQGGLNTLDIYSFPTYIYVLVNMFWRHEHQNQFYTDVGREQL